MIITTNTANTARYKVSIPRIDTSHENVESAKDHGCAVTLLNYPIGEINFAVNAQTTDYPGDWIPRHFLNDNVFVFISDAWSG